MNNASIKMQIAIFYYVILFYKLCNALVLKLWFPPDIKHGYNVQLAEDEP